MRERMDPQILNSTTAMIAESNLMSVRDNIEKNKVKIVTEQDNTMQELRCKAKLCKGGTKEQRVSKLKKLLPLMQRFKRYKTQTALASKQLSLLDIQINAFENGRFQKEMTDTLRAGVVAMRKVGITDDASDVDSLVLDMEDTMQRQNEMNESLTMTLVNTMDDGGSSDDALMRELMALAGEDDDVESEKVVHMPIPKMMHTGDVVTPLVSPTVELPAGSVSMTDEIVTTNQSVEDAVYYDDTERVALVGSVA